MRGWCLTLADGRRFAWSEADGVRSEAQARARLTGQEPGVQIVNVEEEEVAMQVELGVN